MDWRPWPVVRRWIRAEWLIAFAACRSLDSQAPETRAAAAGDATRSQVPSTESKSNAAGTSHGAWRRSQVGSLPDAPTSPTAAKSAGRPARVARSLRSARPAARPGSENDLRAAWPASCRGLRRPTRARPADIAARFGGSSDLMLQQFLQRGAVGKRRLADQHEEERAAERIDVAADVGLAGVAGLLGGHVVERAERHAAGGQLVFGRIGLSRTRASPMSTSLAWPSGVSRMFDGLMSRCTTSRCQACISASAICSM